MLRRKNWAVALAAVFSLTQVAVADTAGDPAEARIEAFSNVLLMPDDSGHTQRREELSSAVAETFNFEVMSEFIVGSPWQQFSVDERARIAEAMQIYTKERFARNFTSSGGETITIDPEVQVRGVDKLVRSTIEVRGDSPDRLDYRMREYQGVWRVIDVYLNGVSDLTARRADLAKSVESGDPDAIQADIRRATAKLAGS